MSEDLYDNATFYLSFPLWFIAKSSSGTWRGPFAIIDPDLGFPFALNDQGEKCWPLFTDEDLAERFGVEMGISGRHLVKVTLSTDHEFLQLLAEIETLGHRRVLFDPRKGVKGVQSHLVTQIRNELRGSGPS